MAKKTEAAPQGDKGKSIRVMNESAFNAFHKTAKNLRGRVDTATEALGKHVKEAEKDKGLNGKGYAFCRQLDKMLEAKVPKPDTVAEILAAVDHYREYLKLDERCNLQGRLQFDGTGKPSKQIQEEAAAGDDAAEEAATEGEDDTRDLRPGFLRQPGASAAEDVRASADRANHPEDDRPAGKPH